MNTLRIFIRRRLLFAPGPLLLVSIFFGYLLLIVVLFGFVQSVSFFPQHNCEQPYRIHLYRDIQEYNSKITMLRNFFIPSLRASGFVQQSRNSLSIRALSSVGEAAPAVGDKCEGVTKWFNYRKGYGFITMNSGSEDVFVHHMNLHCEGFRSLQVRIQFILLWCNV